MDINQYLSIGEVSRILKIYPANIHFYMQTNRFPAPVIIGGRKLFHADDIAAWDKKAILKKRGRKPNRRDDA